MRGPNDKTLVRLLGVNVGTNIVTGKNDPAGSGAGGKITATLSGIDGVRYGKRILLDSLTPDDVANAAAFKAAFDASPLAKGYELDEPSLNGSNFPWSKAGDGAGQGGRTVKPVRDGAITNWQASTPSQAAFSGGEAERRRLMEMTPLGRATLAMEAKQGRERSSSPSAADFAADLDVAKRNLAALVAKLG